MTCDGTILFISIRFAGISISHRPNPILCMAIPKPPAHSMMKRLFSFSLSVHSPSCLFYHVLRSQHVVENRKRQGWQLPYISPRLRGEMNHPLAASLSGEGTLLGETIKIQARGFSPLKSPDSSGTITQGAEAPCPFFSLCPFF